MNQADFQEAQQSAKKGEPRAQTLLALAYQEGRFVDQNEVAAFRLLRKAAEQGFPPAQNMLGSAYELGIGTDSDKAEALKWYRQAARRGSLAAQFNIGNLFERDGPMQDPNLAFAWWIVAAESGDPTAREGLERFGVYASGRYGMVTYLAGAMFMEGSEVPQNVTAGLKLLETSSQVGQPLATLRLAEYYIRGHFVAKDTAKALELLTGVAKEYPGAALLLGDIYSADEFMPHDYKEALRWYQYTLVPETPAGFLRVGSAYLHGRGVSENRLTAAQYFMIGGDLGSRECQRRLDELQLTPTEREEAIKTATKWLGGNPLVLRALARRRPNPSPKKSGP